MANRRVSDKTWHSVQMSLDLRCHLSQLASTPCPDRIVAPRDLKISGRNESARNPSFSSSTSKNQRPIKVQSRKSKEGWPILHETFHPKPSCRSSGGRACTWTNCTEKCRTEVRNRGRTGEQDFYAILKGVARLYGVGCCGFSLGSVLSPDTHWVMSPDMHWMMKGEWTN